MVILPENLQDRPKGLEIHSLIVHLPTRESENAKLSSVATTSHLHC